MTNVDIIKIIMSIDLKNTHKISMLLRYPKTGFMENTNIIWMHKASKTH